MNLGKLPSSAYMLERGVIEGYIDATALRTSRVLELGCGSIEYGWNFLPTVSRELAESGYNITGVDIFDNGLEVFKSIKMDLSEPDNLRELPEEEFYVAFDNNFTGDNRCPMLAEKVSQNGMSWGEYLGKLNGAISRILLNGGIYIRGGFYLDFFQKIDGELVKIRRI